MILVIIYNGNCIAKIAKNIFLTYQIWNAPACRQAGMTRIGRLPARRQAGRQAGVNTGFLLSD